MKCDKHTMLLYAVTDRAWTGRETLRQQVEDALKGGVTCVQLREKELDDAAFLQEAMELSALCRSYGVPFIINDNVEIAIKMPCRRHPRRAGRYGCRRRPRQGRP